MDYNLTVIPKGDYLHTIVTGHNTRENVAGYLKDVLTECLRRRCQKVLIEERLEGPRLSLVDIFLTTSEASVEAIGALRALAYVDVYAEGEGMQFAETVAANRAVPARVFGTVEDAQAWIAEQ